jgi:uncharacterized membrane protein YebE (DUF533 family)
MNADELTEAEQIELMRFLCSFAWADGEVHDTERTVLEQVLGGLTLSPEARADAQAWLSEPPDMEGFDFGAISPEKRSAFIDQAFAVAAAHDGLGAQEIRHLKMFMTFIES